MKILRIAALVALFTATYFAGALCGKAFAATPVDENGKADYDPPLASFIVMQCDEVVVAWWISGDNTAHRMDPMHRPEQEEYAAVLAWLQKGQHDLYIIPCPDAKTGGKQHTKEKS